MGEAITKIVVTEQTCSLAGYGESFLNRGRADALVKRILDVGSAGRTLLELFLRKL